MNRMTLTIDLRGFGATARGSVSRDGNPVARSVGTLHAVARAATEGVSSETEIRAVRKKAAPLEHLANCTGFLKFAGRNVRHSLRPWELYLRAMTEQRGTTSSLAPWRKRRDLQDEANHALDRPARVDGERIRRLLSVSLANCPTYLGSLARALSIRVMACSCRSPSLIFFAVASARSSTSRAWSGWRFLVNWSARSVSA
jgi:hypothetical protein